MVKVRMNNSSFQVFLLRLKVIIKVKQEYHSLHVLNVPSSRGDVHSDALHGKNVVSKC